MPIAVILFLIVIVALVPFLSIYNLKMIDTIKEIMLPDKKKLYFQSALNQLFLTMFAFWAASAVEIKLSYEGLLDNRAIVGGSVFLIIAFSVGYFTSRHPQLEEKNPGLELLKPVTKSEKLSWILVNIVAATCEEIIFRGVLFRLFMITTNNIPAAAIMSALCFGFSHSVQGIIGILITTLFGLGLQYLVYLNDGLLIAMIVHFIYNIGTTFFILKEAEKQD